jgi:hypothetical protein
MQLQEREWLNPFIASGNDDMSGMTRTIAARLRQA